MKFKIGQYVKVIDWGKSYSTNSAWFEKHIASIPVEYLIRYSFGNSYNYMAQRRDGKGKDAKIYKVLYVDGTDVLISPTFSEVVPFASSNEPIFLISSYGLMPYEVKRMTKKQIEKELGYSIEIIEE